MLHQHTSTASLKMYTA